MADVFSRDKRSEVMRAVKSRDTAPELRVRRAAHAGGLRFRLHRRDLPGSPDLVFPRFRVAMFVHGCFWHGHSCRRGARRPASNGDYWRGKIERNVARDQANASALVELGWRPAIVWECETRGESAQLAGLILQRLTADASP